MKAIHVVNDNYPSASSTASVRSVKNIIYKNGFIVLNDQTPFRVVTPRSIVESEGRILSECIDNLPTVKRDTAIKEIVKMMDKHSTDILPVIENDEFFGVISSKSVSKVLFENNRTLNDRFSIAMQHPSIMVYTCDCDLRYTWIYSAHSELIADNMLGKTDFQLIDNENAQYITSIKKKVFETGKPVNTQLKAIVRGKNYHYRLVIEPLRNDDGFIDGLLCASIEITPLVEKVNELEKSKQHFMELADSIAEICFSLDRNFKITYWGKTLGQISGITPDKALGKHVEELYTLFPRRERLVNLIRDVFRTGKVIRTTFKYSEKIYDFNMYPFSDGVMVIALWKMHGSGFQFSYTELWERELKNTIQTIHNGLGQHIAALSMQCAELEIKAITGEYISSEDISSINKICSNTANSLRNLLQSILWRAGSTIPDANFIQNVCTLIENSFNVKIHLHMQDSFFPTGIFERDHIIKFIQEALLNAAKHSGSHQLSLSSDHNDKYLIYRICDRGHGFNPAEKNDGMGLKMMKFNADELAGEMKITSDTTGTVVSLLIPRY